MEARDVENMVKKLDLKNFGGIFSIDQLKDTKILSYPVGLIVYDTGHWISVYLTSDQLEVMDSSGYLTSSKLHSELLNLICQQMKYKKFFATPKLQSDTSSACALFSITFLYYRTLTNRSLCHFSKLFTSNLKKNCETISDLFRFITK